MSSLRKARLLLVVCIARQPLVCIQGTGSERQEAGRDGSEYPSRINDAGRSKQTGPPAPKLILEVMATDWAIGWREDYVYLRVFSDGRAETQIVKVVDLQTENITSVKKTLDQVEFERLGSIVNQRPVANIKTKTIYKPRNSMVHEAGTSWDIRMPRDGHMQEIRIITFAPDEAQQLKQPYPKPVVELGCQIETIRNEVTDEAVNFEEECKKVWAY